MIKVLILENGIPGNQSISKFLRNDEGNLAIEVVNTPCKLFQMLENQHVDVIVAENQSHGFNGISAFEDLRESYPDIPFILCSEPLGDDKVVELLKMGINDYVTWEHLDLLPGKIQEAGSKTHQKIKNEIKRDPVNIEGTKEFLPGAFFELEIIDDREPQINFLSDNFFKALDIAGVKTTKKFPLEEIMAFVPVTERQNLKREFATSAKTLKPVNANFTIIIPGKIYTYIQVFATPRKDRAHGVIWNGVFYDITRKVKMARELANSGQKIENIYGQITDAVLEIDYTDQILYANQKAGKLLKINDSELPGHNMFKLFPRALKSTFYDSYMEAKKTQKPVQYLVFYEPLASWVEGNIFPNKNTISIFFRDVTKEKQKNQKLQEKENFLQLAVDAGGIGLWNLNLKNGIVQDPWLINIMGDPKRKSPLSLKTIWEAIHPEDREKVRGVYYRHYYNFANNFKSEFRILDKRGKYLYITSRGKIIEWDKEGNPSRMVGTHVDLTNQKQNEEKLENLSIVARNTHNGVLIADENKRITWINKGVTKMTGYKLKDIKGKNPIDIFQGVATNPDRVNNIEKRLDAGKTVSAEVLNYKKDGTPFWISLEVTPVIKNGKIEKYIEIFSDITKKKEDEQQLKLLEKVVESSNDGVIITHSQTNHSSGWPEIVYGNKAFTKISGFKPDEIKGKSLSFLIGKDTGQEEIEKITGAFNHGTMIEDDIIIYKKNEDYFWANFSLVPLRNDQKEITHFIFILRDVTSQKLDDIEKRQLINNLQNYNHTLEQYAFITSHNLRAPIAQIIGLTNLIQSDLNQNDLSNYIQYLQDSAHNLDQIIKDLNQLLNIRNNKYLPREKIDIKLLFQEILHKMPEDQGKQINDIKINLEGDILIFTNKEYLEHILYKLLDNCIKFRRKDVPLSVQLDVRQCNDHFLLSINDNGMGFDALQHKERIFRPYQHFNTELEGRGLGLSIVKAHVDALGGNIEVFSEEGQGTTFWITLPKTDLPEFLNAPEAAPKIS